MKIRLLIIAVLMVFSPTLAMAGGKREKAGEASNYSIQGTTHYVVLSLLDNATKDRNGDPFNQAGSENSYLATALLTQNTELKDAEYVVYLSVRNIFSSPGSQYWNASNSGSGGGFDSQKLSILTKVFYKIAPGPRAKDNFRPISGELKTIKSEQQLGQNASAIIRYFGRSPYFRNLDVLTGAFADQGSRSGSIAQALMDENYSIFFQEMPDEVEYLLSK